MRDWASIREDLKLALDGSRLARDRLVTAVGANHGSDRVAWSATLRGLLRDDLIAALASIGVRGPAIERAVDAGKAPFYSLDPYQELRRVSAAVGDPDLRAKIDRHAATLLPRLEHEIESIVPEERLWVGDAECVDRAEDYEPIVADLLALAKLEATAITCREHRGARKLSIEIGRRVHRADLRGDTDYIDEAPLIECLNELLAAAKKPKRYYQVVDPRWGQELGIAYASAVEARRLRDAGLLAES